MIINTLLNTNIGVHASISENYVRKQIRISAVVHFG